jgi:asparagine synthase (glutamine-hydrolysing)
VAAAPPHDHGLPDRRPQFLVELRSASLATAPGPVRWLVRDDPTTVEMGRTSVTYLGTCLADDAALLQRGTRAADHRRWDEVTDLPGSFHVVVVTPDLVVVFGDVVGLRRVFYAQLGDAWLVSDRADVLAGRTGARLDDEWLALWLVWTPPEIATTRSPWEGVVAVPPGGCLVWRPHQAAPLVEIYWTPPAPDLALDEGAPAFAEALSTAVHERVWRAAAPSLDLSGGKDTIALAFLADETRHRAAPTVRTAGRPLLAVTLPSIAADNDDVAWARAVAGSLPSTEHLVVPLAACPLPFDDLAGTDPTGDGWLVTDHPSVATMHSARRRHLAERLRREGRGADHLAGYGGDEVLQAPPAYLASVLRRHPRLALARVRGHAALTGTSAWSVLGAALVPGSQARWLRRAAADVTARRVRSRQGEGGGWGTIAAPAPWLTDRALALAAEEVRRAAALAARSRDVAQHATLARIRAGAATARLNEQSMRRLGVRLHCPYFDRHVVAASLAVRTEHRTDPSAFKPLLDAALAATVPTRFRTRPTKSHYAEDTAFGLWRNRHAVERLAADARLAERGLVDADRLRRAIGRPRDQSGSMLALADALSCERWLRAAEAAA